LVEGLVVEFDYPGLGLLRDLGPNLLGGGECEGEEGEEGGEEGQSHFWANGQGKDEFVAVKLTCRFGSDQNQVQ
jgi:hypothetical protein